MHTAPLSVPGPPKFAGVTGLHVIAGLYDCPNSPLMTDAAALENVCKEYVREAGLLDVGALFHAFPGDSGVTGTVVLAESHLAIHTWPEHGYISLDVFVCNYSGDNSGKARHLASRLIALFTPGEQRVQEIIR